jgi:hypothetical protein
MVKYKSLSPCSSVDRALASGAKSDGSSPSRGTYQAFLTRTRHVITPRMVINAATKKLVSSA